MKGAVFITLFYSGMRTNGGSVHMGNPGCLVFLRILRFS